MFGNLDSKEIIAVFVYAISIIITIFTVIAEWKIFKKAGRKGWQAIIPFYSDYVTCDIAWDKKYYFLILPFYLIYMACEIFRYFFANKFFGYNNVILTVMALMTIAEFVYLAGFFIMNCMLAKAFGKGAGFMIGMFFLPTIFLLILAFGESEYIGNSKKRKEFKAQKASA